MAAVQPLVNKLISARPQTTRWPPRRICANSQFRRRKGLQWRLYLRCRQVRHSLPNRQTVSRIYRVCHHSIYSSEIWPMSLHQGKVFHYQGGSTRQMGPSILPLKTSILSAHTLLCIPGRTAHIPRVIRLRSLRPQAHTAVYLPEIPSPRARILVVCLPQPNSDRGSTIRRRPL